MVYGGVLWQLWIVCQTNSWIKCTSTTATVMSYLHINTILFFKTFSCATLLNLWVFPIYLLLVIISQLCSLCQTSHVSIKLALFRFACMDIFCRYYKLMSTTDLKTYIISQCLQITADMISQLVEDYPLMTLDKEGFPVLLLPYTSVNFIFLSWDKAYINQPK